MSKKLTGHQLLGRAMGIKGFEAKKHKHHKNWIAGAIKHPGALHKELGVKAGEKIPSKKLNAAAGKSGVEGKRARLAQTLKSFHKGKHAKHHKHEKHEKSEGGLKFGSPEWRAKYVKKHKHMKHRKGGAMSVNQKPGMTGTYGKQPKGTDYEFEKSHHKHQACSHCKSTHHKSSEHHKHMKHEKAHHKSK